MDHEQKLTGVKRINLLKVPLDILKEEDMEATIRELHQQEGPKQIVLLNFAEFMRSRRDPERQRMLKEAALVIPTSGALLRGARFLKKGELIRYMPFEFVIRLMGILEPMRGSVYLLGEKNKDLNISSANLRASFPGALIVGRHVGYFSSQREKDVVLAIRKTTPALLLGGFGLKGKDRWIFRRKDELGAKFSLWCGECFKIFCGKARRPSRKQWEKGSESMSRIARNPFRIFGIFPRMLYGMLLLIYKIRKL